MKADYQQYSFWHPKLRELVAWLEESTGLEFTATSMYRMDDPGVHGTLPLRAVDLRMWNEQLGEVIEEFINDHWQYDPERWKMHCCLFHNAGTGLHLHLQVHPNTKLVN